MAGGQPTPPRGAYAGGHPITVHPARPLYRFCATGLGAAMWFFVCAISCMIVQLADQAVATIPRETRRAGIAGMETSVGALSASIPIEAMKMD